MALLEVKDLEVSYGLIKAVKGVSFEVNAGEIVTLIGANGAGKTTIMHAINNLIGKDAGKVIFDGKDISGVAAHKLVKTGLAQVPEGRRIFNELTVYENLRMGYYSKTDKGHFQEKIEEMYSYFPILKERKDQIAGTLSGGEQQRVAIARGLIYEPQIIFLDEPTGNLDSKNSDEIMLLLRQINQELNTTILQVTHSEKNALYGNRIIRIADGKVFDDSVLQENSDEPNLQITNENTQEIEETMQDGLTE